MGEGISLKRYRKYIQYNNLVFDGYEMLGEYDASSTSFKSNTHELSYGHGSYAPFKANYSFVEESSVSMTLWLEEKKLPCEKRDFYRSFAIEQLTKHGRLWAVQDNTLVWAYATISSYSEMVEHLNGSVGIDVEFLLYEGIWHKADKQKTFLHPYDVCTFLECYDYKKLHPCSDEATYQLCPDCETGLPFPDNKDELCCDCGCNHLDKYMALCYHEKDLQDFYKYCEDAGFRVVYDCGFAQEVFGRVGQKICVNSCQNGTIAGKIYSDTDMPTTRVKVTLIGKMHNPYVEINGNGNYIKGDYDGTLVIDFNGDVYYENCGNPCEPEPADVWGVPKGMDYGWTIVPRNNRVIVNLGACCGSACAYFDIDSITI